MYTRVYIPVFFDISILEITVLLRVHSLYRCTFRCYVASVCNTPFLKNIVFFRIHILHEAVKSVHTGVHTGIFRHFIPKNHWFDPCSFLHGGVCVMFFRKNTVFFRIHALHEVM